MKFNVFSIPRKLQATKIILPINNDLTEVFPSMSHLSAPPDPKQESKAHPLFRTQAVEHVTAKQYGTVILTSHVSHRVLTFVSTLSAIGIISFFILFSTTRKAESRGVLLPTTGVIRVTPVQPGLIIERHVKEGQAVNAGQLMFVLSGERSSASAESAEKKISALLERQVVSLQAELRTSEVQATQRSAVAQRRVQDSKIESRRALDQITLQKYRVSLAEQALKRYSELEATHYISSAQLQDKQAELLDQRQRLAELERALAASERELATAEADSRDLQLQTQREAGAIGRNISALQQNLTENEARRETLVRAPLKGIVAAVAAEVGQTVGPASTLASILPKGAELQAEIYVPSRSVGFVKPGMTVLLRYHAYPYEKFGQYRARVREVADTSMLPSELGLSQSASSEPLYRIRLTLDAQTIKAYGQPLPLKSGMLVDASIHLDHRRLYEWVLEPLFSISGR